MIGVLEYRRYLLSLRAVSGAAPPPDPNVNA
jgi:hypothetical protein